MLLRDGTTSLRLAVVGYQFPLAPDPERRFSWHMVEGGVEASGGGWRFRCPALRCDETPRVAMWLTAVADWLNDPGGMPAPGRLTFMESNLAFSVEGHEPDSVRLAIDLDQECRPPWQRARDDSAHRLLISQNAIGIRNAAAAWSAEARVFPDGLDPVPSGRPDRGEIG